MHMFWNRSESLPQTLRTTTAIGRWVVVYLLGSYLYSSLTYDHVENTPALLIPSLMPLSVLSACVSWQIEKEIDPAHVKPSASATKPSILPLLCMSVFYSSVVEGFLFEWFLRGGLRPWLRIGIDLLCLSPSSPMEQPPMSISGFLVKVTTVLQPTYPDGCLHSLYPYLDCGLFSLSWGMRYPTRS